MCKTEAAFLRTNAFCIIMRLAGRWNVSLLLSGPTHKKQHVGDGGLALSSSNNIYGNIKRIRIFAPTQEMGEFVEKMLSEIPKSEKT